MAQHYFAVYWDSETGQLHIDPAEVSINYDQGNIFDPKEDDWVFGEEYEIADQLGYECLSQALRQWNEGNND